MGESEFSSMTDSSTESQTRDCSTDCFAEGFWPAEEFSSMEVELEVDSVFYEPTVIECSEEILNQIIPTLHFGLVASAPPSLEAKLIARWCGVAPSVIQHILAKQPLTARLLEDLPAFLRCLSVRKVATFIHVPCDQTPLTLGTLQAIEATRTAKWLLPKQCQFLLSCVGSGWLADRAQEILESRPRLILSDVILQCGRGRELCMELAAQTVLEILEMHEPHIMEWFFPSISTLPHTRREPPPSQASNQSQTRNSNTRRGKRARLAVQS